MGSGSPEPRGGNLGDPGMCAYVLVCPWAPSGSDLGEGPCWARAVSEPASQGRPPRAAARWA
eukprot:2581099-Pyramimonas_sp.AAC.2